MVALLSGEAIPDTDHVLRYCSPRHLQNKRVLESAFELRENEKSLSANWLEYFEPGAGLPNPVQQLITSVGGKLKLKTHGRFARLHVGTAKQKITGIDITYMPKTDNPSHADIALSQEGNRQEQALALANMISLSDTFPVSVS